jgi:hypothetical protein
MPDPSHALTLQFLAWVADGPRSYAEAMEAWRSTCPRLSIWEDAILDRLIAFDGGATRNQSRVVLTPKGRAMLVASKVPGEARADPSVEERCSKGPSRAARVPFRSYVPSR